MDSEASPEEEEERCRYVMDRLFNLTDIINRKPVEERAREIVEHDPKFLSLTEDERAALVSLAVQRMAHFHDLAELENAKEEEALERADSFKVRLEDGTEAATGVGLHEMPAGECADCGKGSDQCENGMVFDMEPGVALCFECMQAHDAEAERSA